MRLPEIAERLRELAVTLNTKELSDLADEIGRRPAGTRARPTSTPMSDELRDKIRAYRKAQPGLSQAKIGAHFNVNPGRVSEAIKGKRK